jgi:hypothetical protein
MKNNNELYETPASSVIELLPKRHILTGSPETDSAGIQDYIENSVLSW